MKYNFLLKCFFTMHKSSESRHYIKFQSVACLHKRAKAHIQSRAQFQSVACLHKRAKAHIQSRAH